MAPMAPQGAVKLAPAIAPIDAGMPKAAPSDASGFAGDRIKPVIPPSVPGASRMTR
jgi:hypothetical protein